MTFKFTYRVVIEDLSAESIDAILDALSTSLGTSILSSVSIEVQN